MIIKTLTPEQFKEYRADYPVSFGYCQTPAGIMRVGISNGFVVEACFHTDGKALTTDDIRASLEHYYQISQLLLIGTEFQCKVWKAAYAIPAGTTKNYKQIAQQIDHPNAARAVGTALGQNKIAYFIPCHRVINSDGNPGGYAWGIDLKTALLQAEQAL